MHINNINIMEFQTSSYSQNTKYSGLCFFESLTDAIKAFREDNTIWKISFDDRNGEEYRVVPKFTKDKWENDTEKQIRELSECYCNSKKNSLFWINLPFRYSEGKLQTVVTNVWSDEEFSNLSF